MTVALLAATSVRPLTVARERVILWFATIQLFSIIYLQKFALAGNSTPLSVPMLVLFGSIGLMLVGWRDVLTINPKRLVAYLAFIFFCLWSEAFTLGSPTSFLQLVMLYAMFTVCVEVSEKTYMTILNRFVMMMVLPALIIIEQFAYQKLTGRTDPLDLEAFFPPSLLLQGFNYSGHVPWNSPFIRPNGFFFLEPSVVSAFTACAAIIEMTYFRRIYLVLLLVLAMLIGMGGTGLTMLGIAAPFLLARERPITVILATATMVTMLCAALMLDLNLPVVSRANELGNESSSASERLLLPAQKLADYASDPRYFFMGEGAGAATPSNNSKSLEAGAKGLKSVYNSKAAVINPWPVVKLIQEYGFLSALTFMVFYLIAVAGNFNLPVKVGLSVIYLFTGGYLLNPIMVGLVVSMCTMWKIERRT